MSSANAVTFDVLDISRRGACYITGRLPRMRAAQEFIVYPFTASDSKIRIQSDTRFGQISLVDGSGVMTPRLPNGEYSSDLARPNVIKVQLSPLDLNALKEMVSTSTATSRVVSISGLAR